MEQLNLGLEKREELPQSVEAYIGGKPINQMTEFERSEFGKALQNEKIKLPGLDREKALTELRFANMDDDRADNSIFG